MQARLHAATYIFQSQHAVRRRHSVQIVIKVSNFSRFTKPVRSCSWIMFYKMLFDRFVGFAYLYTVLDIPRQIRIVCLHKVSVLCFVNNGLADKTSTEPGLISDSNVTDSLLQRITDVSCGSGVSIYRRIA